MENRNSPMEKRSSGISTSFLESQVSKMSDPAHARPGSLLGKLFCIASLVLAATSLCSMAYLFSAVWTEKLEFVYLILLVGLPFSGFLLLLSLMVGVGRVVRSDSKISVPGNGKPGGQGKWCSIASVLLAGMSLLSCAVIFSTVRTDILVAVWMLFVVLPLTGFFLLLGLLVGITGLIRSRWRRS